MRDVDASGEAYKLDVGTGMNERILDDDCEIFAAMEQMSEERKFAQVPDKAISSDNGAQLFR